MDYQQALDEFDEGLQQILDRHALKHGWELGTEFDQREYRRGSDYILLQLGEPNFRAVISRQTGPGRRVVTGTSSIKSVAEELAR